MSDQEVRGLAGGFYNDTYLMDQNACSSPHFIFWIHPDGKGQGRRRFWKALANQALQYDLPEKKAMDKYTLLCEQAAGGLGIRQIETYGNRLYVASLSELPDNLEDTRGIFGLFLLFMLLRQVILLT